MLQFYCVNWGYVFFTEDSFGDGNPWDDLSTYFTTFLEAVEKAPGSAAECDALAPTATPAGAPTLAPAEPIPEATPAPASIIAPPEATPEPTPAPASIVAPPAATPEPTPAPASIIAPPEATPEPTPAPASIIAPPEATPEPSLEPANATLAPVLDVAPPTFAPVGLTPEPTPESTDAPGPVQVDLVPCILAAQDVVSARSLRQCLVITRSIWCVSCIYFAAICPVAVSSKVFAVSEHGFGFLPPIRITCCTV